MDRKKQFGSYYTPDKISNFVVKYVFSKLPQSQKISVLEPSAGDGSFVKAILSDSSISNRVSDFLAIEVDPFEVKEIAKVSDAGTLRATCADFLLYDSTLKEKFDLVVGNPPFVSRKYLAKEQLGACALIHQQFHGLSRSKVNNIWTAFLLKAILHTKDTGIVALILPADLLQVKYAAELRSLLMVEFQRVEVLTFNELVFDECKGQDTVVLVCERRSEERGLFFSTINSKDELNPKSVVLSSPSSSRDKWTHHALEADDFSLLEKLRAEMNCLGDFCNSRAGIVTGANKFFVLNERDVEQYDLGAFVKRIVQKGAFVNGGVSFTDDDFAKIITSEKPAFLLSLSSSSDRTHPGLVKYLAIGAESGILDNYKLAIRNDWFVVPNVGEVPEAIFFKRCHEYPKFVLNRAGVLSADSGYLVSAKPGFNVKSLIYSFYNSVSLVYAELNGRFYGGGVLEITPNEFRNLPIPYTAVTDREFSSFEMSFKRKNSIDDVCLGNDANLFHNFAGLIDSFTLNRIKIIRSKLFRYRTER